MTDNELYPKHSRPWWPELKDRHLTRGGTDDRQTMGALYMLGLEVLNQHWDAETLDALLVEFDRRADMRARESRENQKLPQLDMIY